MESGLPGKKPYNIQIGAKGTSEKSEIMRE